MLERTHNQIRDESWERINKLHYKSKLKSKQIRDPQHQDAELNCEMTKNEMKKNIKFIRRPFKKSNRKGEKKSYYCRLRILMKQIIENEKRNPIKIVKIEWIQCGCCYSTPRNISST